MVGYQWGKKLMLSLLCQWTRDKLTNKVCAVKISNVTQQKLIQKKAETVRNFIFLLSMTIRPLCLTLLRLNN